MYLTQILHRNLQRQPDRTALVCGAERLTFRQLHARAARLAGHLQSIGVRRGDRVALLSLNSIECVELMFAAWWIGAIFCPVNTRWSLAEIADSLGDCTPGVLFVDETHAALAAPLAERVRCLRHVIRIVGSANASPDSYPALLAGAGPIPDSRFGSDDVAALVYTGGTTGRSKGVMLTHATLGAAAVCRLADNERFDDSVALVSTPIFHVASLVRLTPHLMAGGACVLLPQFQAEEALMLIERECVTDVPFVPTMLQMILDYPTFRPERMRSVKRLSYGAAPSAGALLQRTLRTLPWVGLYQFYGMTESSGIATMSLPSDHSPQGWTSGLALSAGRAGSLVEVRVVDENDEDAAPGQVGEILLRGPMVSPGYWNRPEESARTFRDGWLHTGDAGALDADGYLYVVDRVKDMIVTGGENVYSAEVENALAQHPAVSTVAVIGIPSDQWGEAVHAVVVLRQGAATDETGLKVHCRALVAAYKTPKSFEFVDALPLTAAGKIAKNVLREKYWQGYARRVN
jgi:long-chain acyl-CoA synthetase